MTVAGTISNKSGAAAAEPRRAAAGKSRRSQRPGIRARRALAEARAAQGADQDAARGARGASLRRCVASGESKDRGDLIRFVVAPDGSVVPDLEGRLPGRGLWLTPDRDVLGRTKLAAAFARAAKGKVTVAPDLADRLERMLAARCRDLLGLARRAGQAVIGYEQVRAFLRDGSPGGRAGVLVAARDGAAGGRDKLRHLAPDWPLVDILDSAEIGAAFGAGAMVHVALADGRLARDFLQAARQLAGLRRPRGGAIGPSARKVEDE